MKYLILALCALSITSCTNSSNEQSYKVKSLIRGVVFIHSLDKGYSVGDTIIIGSSTNAGKFVIQSIIK